METKKAAMELITKNEREQLVRNYHDRISGKITDPMSFIPVIHFITLDGKKSWMITELSDQDCDVAYGLFTEYDIAVNVGPISIRQMVRTIDKTGFGIFKVQPFNPPYKLAIYERIQSLIVQNGE